MTAVPSRTTIKSSSLYGAKLQAGDQSVRIMAEIAVRADRLSVARRKMPAFR